ncbi:MAG: hypothetical protein IKK08_03970 [Clostridia bacterium]|nr:hypothetical protein [Clostridia bacterium]
MKKRGFLVLCAWLLVTIAIVPIACAEDDPVACTIEISPEFLVGPGDVSVTITVSNVTDKDLQDPVLLFNPQAVPITDFGDDGLVSLMAGESKTWTGTYSVNERELEQGYIQYFAKYTVYQDNGQAAPSSQSIRATVSRTEAEVGVDVDRTITPSSAHEGQEVLVKYTITNSGTVALTDVSIVENESINSKTQSTEKQLDPGAKIEITYKATMGKKDLTSSATISYKAVGTDKTETYTVDEKKIPYAQADLSASLSSDVKGVLSGGTVKLTLELKNKGSVDMTDLRVSDPILGDVFTNQMVEAGKTLTLEKEITLTETADYQFTVQAIDSTGTEISALTNQLSLTAMSPDEALHLTLNATPDQTEIYDDPAEVRFTLTITNDSNVDATDVKIAHGYVDIYTFESIAAGESRTLSRDAVLSNSGKFQFSAVAKDPLENENTFLSNEMQIAVYQPTPPPATPTVPPVPTAEPTFVPVTVVPIRHESIGTFPKAVQKVLLPALIVIGVLLLAGSALLIVAAKKRHDDRKASKAALDHLERTRRRDYVTANPEEMEATSKATLRKNQQPEEEPEPDVVLVTDNEWELPTYDDTPAAADRSVAGEGYSSFGQGFYGEVEADGFEPAPDQSAGDAFQPYDGPADSEQPAYEPQYDPASAWGQNTPETEGFADWSAVDPALSVQNASEPQQNPDPSPSEGDTGIYRRSRK